MNKARRNTRIGPVGAAILGTIAAGTILTIFAVAPGLSYAVAPFIKKKKYSQKQAIERNLESLIASGMIKRKILPDGKMKLSLTTRGKWEAALRHGKINLESNKKWDGQWRIVIFDIPNDKNKIRADVRRALQMYGFRSLQKSVWVYPFESDDFIAMLKSHLRVTNDVLYIKSSYIENDKHLRREFNV